MTLNLHKKYISERYNHYYHCYHLHKKVTSVLTLFPFFFRGTLSLLQEVINCRKLPLQWSKQVTNLFPKQIHPKNIVFCSFCISLLMPFVLLSRKECALLFSGNHLFFIFLFFARHKYLQKCLIGKIFSSLSPPQSSTDPSCHFPVTLYFLEKNIFLTYFFLPLSCLAFSSLNEKMYSHEFFCILKY